MPYTAAEIWLRLLEIVLSSALGTLFLMYALSLAGLLPRAEKKIPPKPVKEVDDQTGC